MTKIKMCGLSRPCDIEAANALGIDYVGFVFAEKSRRYVSPERAAELKKLLSPEIKAVGVFVNSPPAEIAKLLEAGVIDIAQLHGSEDEDFIRSLRQLTDRPIIKAFRIDSADDIASANASSADFVLLDSGGGGTGSQFDWQLVKEMTKPYFLAGGLDPANVKDALNDLSPYAVDVSSGIESGGLKDKEKMQNFVSAVRGKEEEI